MVLLVSIGIPTSVLDNPFNTEMSSRSGGNRGTGTLYVHEGRPDSPKPSNRVGTPVVLFQ